MRSLVCLEVGALGVDFVASRDIASVNFASLEGIPAVTVDVIEATTVSSNSAVSSTGEANPRRQRWSLVKYTKIKKKKKKPSIKMYHHNLLR